MDKFMNIAKDFVQDDKKEEQAHGQPLPGGDKSHGGAYPAGGGFLGALGGLSNDDQVRKAAEEASRRAGDHGDATLFSQILGSISQKKELERDDIDEEDAVKKHQKYFGDKRDDDDDDEADDRGLGAAAAMQALKVFSSGQQAPEKQGQGDFMALAMSEGAKLFDQKASQGKVASGSSKESAVQQAGEMALKMYLKSQGQQQSGGLADMASKFLK